MVVRYGEDVLAEDVETLKQIYCISYRNAELTLKETQFILKYRNKLYDSIEYIWKAYVSDEKENTQKALDGIIEVASMVENYMKSANEGNIKQRMLFVNSIDKEVKCIHNSILWLLHKYSGENSINSEKIENEFVTFLKFVATNTLIENKNLTELINQNNLMQVVGLMNKLKKNFITYVDPQKVTFYDNYFLLGECLSKIEDIKQKDEKLVNERCNGCLLDDCAINHCATYSTRIELENDLKTYNRVAGICTKRLQGIEVEEEQVDKAYKYITDDVIKKILRALVEIPPIETRTDRVKKINVESLTSKPNLIDESKVQEILAGMITCPLDKKYYEDVNLIALSLLLTRCDYSQAKGDQIVTSFEEWYEKTGKNLKRETSELSYTGRLIKMFEELNNENNQEKENK